MAEDIRNRLRKQLGGATPKGLPGQGPRQLEDKGQRPAPEEKAPMYMPVDVYLMTDGTSSMEPVIAAVRTGLEEIATELLQQPDRGDIKISTGVVRDHFCPPSEADMLQALYFDKRPTLRPMQPTDYLQIHNLNGNLRELQTRISAIQCVGNADDAEAYECGWLALAKRITTNPQRKGRKQVAVFFGDMIPHRASRDPKPYLLEITGPRGTYKISDFGCPHGIDPVVAWQALDAATDLALFVGCTEYGEGYASSRYKGYGVDRLQRRIVEAARGERNTSKFVPLQEISDIPALITAGTRLAQSEAAFREYAQRQLTDSGRRDRIAGYLEMNKP